MGIEQSDTVIDLIKYMVPSYLQKFLTAQLGLAGFDLHTLAILASAIEHLVHSEMTSIVYSTFKTLKLPIPGKKTEEEVDEILDTFMMVYAFGLNLDASVLDDVQKAKAHLDRSHAAWPQLRAFAQEVKNSAMVSGELDFAEIVHLVLKIGEGYAQWQGKDCARVKEELVAKPSQREGQVLLSEVTPSYATGRRSLLTDSSREMQMLGALSTASDEPARLIIPNYVNSQSMCLSTTSFYMACCPNECQGILATLERSVAAPAVAAAELPKLKAALPGPALREPLLQELHALVEKESGMLALHGHAFAEWMHRAFPLECPSPRNHGVTNPKTPDDWMTESGLEIADMDQMIDDVARAVSRYAAMGRTGNVTTAPAKRRHVVWVTGDGETYDWEVLEGNDVVSDASDNVVRIEPTPHLPRRRLSGWDCVATVVRLGAMTSMIVLMVSRVKSGLLADISPVDKKCQDLATNKA
jgi:hypothetical protein